MVIARPSDPTLLQGPRPCPLQAGVLLLLRQDLNPQLCGTCAKDPIVRMEWGAALGNKLDPPLVARTGPSREGVAVRPSWPLAIVGPHGSDVLCGP